jgi:subfamily B ATP-binding cassette protein MsbA
MLLLSVLIGLLDGLGLTMFLPLLQMADGGIPAAGGEGLGNLDFVIKGINAVGIVLNIKAALLMLFIFFVLKGIVVYIASVYKVKINQFFVSTLRINLTNLFTRYSFRAFVTSDVGRIQNSFTGEIARISGAYSNYSECIQQIVMVLVYLGFVFMVDWKFAILVCAGGLISNIFFRNLFKKTKLQSTELTKNNTNFHGFIIQYITNFKYLKATGFLSAYAKKLISGIKLIENNNTQMGILNAQITALREPFMIGIVCLVILIQVTYLDGNLGAIMVSLLFFYRALTALMAFQSKYNSFLSASGALDNITDFEHELNANSETVGTTELNSFKHTVVLKNTDFGYDEPDGVLKEINLRVEKNQTVAFVGESGSGKTTLVNLVSGLLKPNRGTVLIDGISHQDLNINSYQARIGYISQDPVMFNDSIFNNVTFWAPPTEANKLRFFESIDKAALSAFVQDLPEQEQTLLGNNGINLSGGQKQRISIARELYKDIDILILDEATSALDSETEREIQKNIDALKGTYTILIIAHRLATIKKADVIYLMDKGRIIENGNFEQLILTSERFKRMVELQEI